jgi:hypothetical protein
MRFLDSFRNFLMSIPDVQTKFGNNVRYAILPANINSEGWWLRWDIVSKEPFYYAGMKSPAYFQALVVIDIFNLYPEDVELFADTLVDKIYETSLPTGVIDITYEGTDFTYYEERKLNVATIKLQIKYE